MRKQPNLLAVLALAIASWACGQLSDTGPVQIEVEVAPDLDGGIEVVAESSRKPGEKNAAEASLEVRNRGVGERRLYVRTAWTDDRGGQRGGNNEYTLQAGATTHIDAATMSQDATQLHVLLRAASFEAETRLLMVAAVPWREAPTLEQIVAGREM